MGERAEYWDRYLRWNNAVAEVVYATSNAGLPVYLDLEGDVLDAIRDQAEPQAESGTAGLVQAVRGVLRLDHGPSAMLRAFLQRLDEWENGDLEDPPPTLALLAVMSLAAENMREGDGKAANNFYGRLSELLGLDEKQREDFIAAYRKTRGGRATSDILWGSLSLWMELHEGNRGLVTVWAERNVHVSLPMSQALVRGVDRDKFRTMFALYGLAPRSTLPGAEVVEVINDWMSHTPCPASNQLERLWKRDADARERIADVALLTLESWDGSGVSEAQSTKEAGLHFDRIRVRARMRSFPRKGVELSLLLATADDVGRGTATVLDLDGNELGEIDLVPAASGWIGLAEPGAIDAGSFLAGETKLRRARTGLMTRRPRRVVPLRFDDMLQGYLECERVNLGDDLMLLVHHDVAHRVDLVLDAAARPGHERYDELDGLPEGWILFDRVQILSAISPALIQHVDLNPLQPIASTHAALQGGLVLPGNIKKWSSYRPPELRVSVDDQSGISATVSSIRALTSPAPKPITQETSEPVLIWDLGAAHLPDGDYEIAIGVEGSPMGRPIRMRLRSADHPALAVDDGVGPIGHDPDDPAFGLLGSRRPSARMFQVAPTDTGHDIDADSVTTAVPRWFRERTQLIADPTAHRGNSAIYIASPPAGSCMLTGAHVMALETVYPGQPKQKLIDGVCRHCGLTKRYPTRGRQKRSHKPSHRTGPVFDPTSLAPIQPRAGVDWRVGLDALSHLGSGPISSLERIAVQIDPTGLFADTFIRRLEVLGHLEIHRSATTLRPVSWVINPPSLVGLGRGRFELVGFRSESMVAAIEDAAHRHGLCLDEEAIEGPPVLSLRTSEPELLHEILHVLAVATGRAPQLIPEAARALAGALPPLGHVLGALPTIGATEGGSIERWDPVTARFAATSNSHAPGAYRLGSFGNIYLYRRPNDIAAMTAILGDARIVKYAAALDAGMPLVGYDEVARVLYVPLGADLPSLYGRAAVLASGRPPAEDSKQRILRYEDIPPALAARLQTLLMS